MSTTVLSKVEPELWSVMVESLHSGGDNPYPVGAAEALTDALHEAGYVILRRNDAMHAMDALHRRAKALRDNPHDVVQDNRAMFENMVERINTTLRAFAGVD